MLTATEAINPLNPAINPLHPLSPMNKNPLDPIMPFKPYEPLETLECPMNAEGETSSFCIALTGKDVTPTRQPIRESVRHWSIHFSGGKMAVTVRYEPVVDAFASNLRV